VRARGKLEPARRAAPRAGAIPSGDRLAYSQDEGSFFIKEKSL